MALIPTALASAQLDRSITVQVALSATVDDVSDSYGTPHSRLPKAQDDGVGRVSDPLGRGAPPAPSEPMAHGSSIAEVSEPLARGPADQTPQRFAISSMYPMPTEATRVQRHRDKVPKQPLFPYAACVARPVNKAESAKTPKVQVAMQKEWDRLRQRRLG